MIAKNLNNRKMYTTLMHSLRSSTTGPLLMVILLIHTMVIADEPIKLHPLGDSTTYGYETENCWRYYMYKKLKENGYNNIDFVGSKNSPTKGKIEEQWDRDHDGHTSQSAHGLLNRGGNSNIKVWALKFKPHIVVIYLGTNDIRGRRKTEDIIKTLTEITQVYRDARKEVKIVVCQLPYWNWGKGGSKAAVDALNAKIPSLKDRGTDISPIKIVDLNTDYTLKDLRDKIHPGVTGAQKIANRVYSAIVPWLNGSTITPVKQKMVVINKLNPTTRMKSGLHLTIQGNMPTHIWFSEKSGSDIRNGGRYLITGRKITKE